MKFPVANSNMRVERTSAFTLIEMLVVLVIIGIMAAIGLPALKGIGQGNVLAAASRQLMDDIAFARQKAISSRTTVWMVFVPTNVVDRPTFLGNINDSNTTVEERRLITNLFGAQYTTYALYTEGNVGDQIGKPTKKYLTEWKTLPEGVFISREKFEPIRRQDIEKVPIEYRPFLFKKFPFPLSESNPSNFTSPTGSLQIGKIPCIGFNSRGQLISEEVSDRQYDAVIPLSRGSIFYARDRDGNLIPGPADVQETPPGSVTNNYTRVRIDWLTGRAKIERPELQ